LIVLIVLALAFIISFVFFIIWYIKENKKLFSIETHETKKLLYDFFNHPAYTYFDIEQYKKRTTPLDQREKNTIFNVMLDKHLDDKNARSILFHLTNTSNYIASQIQINLLIKRILVFGNTYNISEFIDQIGKGKIKLVNNNNSKSLWTYIISILQVLEFHTTNDLVDCLSSNFVKVAQKYKKSIVIKLLNVSVSLANSNDTAKSIITRLSSKDKLQIFSKIIKLEECDEKRKLSVLKDILNSEKTIMFQGIIRKINIKLKN